MFTSHLRVQLSSLNFCRTEEDELKRRTLRAHSKSSLRPRTPQAPQFIHASASMRDSCSVCDLLQRHLTPAQHTSCLFLQCLYVAAAKSDTPHRVSSRFSVIHDILDAGDYCCCLFGGGMLIPGLLFLCATCEYWKVHMLF